MKSGHLSFKYEGWLLPVLTIFTISQTTLADSQSYWYREQCEIFDAQLTEAFDYATAILDAQSEWIPGSKYQDAMTAYLGPDSSSDAGWFWSYLQVIQGHKTFVRKGELLLADLFTWYFQATSRNCAQDSRSKNQSIHSELMTSIYTAALEGLIETLVRPAVRLPLGGATTNGPLARRTSV